mmetsp:Transcript_114283/g.328311  ORF Transcript_114283/g.328311 Transcript_114283/m.328311 type:complete len:219 (-) Transcript_114283:1028-1684(-)
MRQGVALHEATLARHEEALFRGRDAGDRVLRRRDRGHEALLVVHACARGEGLVDVEHHLRAALVADAEHRSGGGEVVGLLRDAAAVEPDIDDVVRGHDDMRVRHGYVEGLDVQVLRVHRAADVVADDDDVLPARVISLRHQHAILVRRSDVRDVLDVLGVLLVALGVPEDNDVLAALLLKHGVDESVREVAPQVVRPDVSEIDVRVHGQGQPQAGALP